MVNNCHIPGLVQTFAYVENDGLNLVLKLAKPLTSMTVAENSIKLTTMCEQNKQHLILLIIFLKTKFLTEK